MKIQLKPIKYSQFDTLVAFVGWQDKEKKIKTSSLPQHMSEWLEMPIKEKRFLGEEKEMLFVPYAHSNKHFLFIGIGDLKELHLEKIRQIGSIILKRLQIEKVKKAGVLLETLSFRQKKETLQALAEGILLTSYNYKGLKKDKKPSFSLEEIYFLMNSVLISNKKALEKGVILAECTNFAKTLSDTPPNYMNPPILARKTQEKAKNLAQLKVSVWNEARIKKEKMGGLEGVSLGSGVEPRFIIMEYKGARGSKKPVCFVGKGLTFDSGGLSLKPPGHMADMKYDMCGGATVIATLLAIAKLKLKVNVLGLIPSSENVVGERATRPSDVLIARNGMSVEVLNTDAEGRLILMDALSYASEKKPAAIFNIATLTGAIVVSLGNVYTGYFTEYEKLSKSILQASERSGEKVWRMPLEKVHYDEMKGSYADLQNIQKSMGMGSSTAAGFLGHFVKKEIPWAHFDIAGTSDKSSNRLPYVPKTGATGVMVRTFIELLKNY